MQVLVCEFMIYKRIYIYEFKWFTQQIVNLASWTIQAKMKIGFKSQVPFNKCTVLGLNGYVRCYKWGLSWDSGKLDEWHYSRVFYIKKKGGEVQKNLGPEHPESIIWLPK